MDKINYLIEAAGLTVLTSGFFTELNDALETFKESLASGEVVVTTWDDYSRDCENHPNERTRATGITHIRGDVCAYTKTYVQCTRTNCPRLGR